MNSAVVINEVLRMMRQGSNLQDALAFVAGALTEGLSAARCVIWIVENDCLVAKVEHSLTGMSCFSEHVLSPQESMTIIMDFLSRFPSESGGGVLRHPDFSKSLSAAYLDLLELGNVRGQVLCQLRSRGIFSGFIDVQYDDRNTDSVWDEARSTALEEVSMALSVVVGQMNDLARMESDIADMKLIVRVSGILAETREPSAAFSGAAAHIATQMGFENCQIYLRDDHFKGRSLQPQVRAAGAAPLDMGDGDNPFVLVAETGMGKTFNAEMTPKPNKDPFFNYEVAALFPLKADGETIGSMGLWRRLPKMGSYTPQSGELISILSQMIAMYAKAISP